MPGAGAVTSPGPPQAGAPAPRPARHPDTLLPWAVSKVESLSHYLCSATTSPLPAASPATEPLCAARGRGEAAQQKADPVSPPARLISAHKSPARSGGT